MPPRTIGYFGKRGELRLYSGTGDGAGGFYYFTVAFEQGDLTFPGGRPRPDELPVLDRGVYTSYAHMLQGPDVPIISPTQVTFGAQIDSLVNRDNLFNALCNPTRNNPWLVNGVVWTNVNGTTILQNGFGSFVSTVSPYDPLQDRINMATLWYTDTTGTSNTGFNLKEIYFRPDNIRIVEALDSLKFQVTGLQFGPISSISAFDPGTSINPV
jgi:hypothetical protein